MTGFHLPPMTDEVFVERTLAGAIVEVVLHDYAEAFLSLFLCAAVTAKVKGRAVSDDIITLAEGIYADTYADICFHSLGVLSGGKSNHFVRSTQICSRKKQKCWKTLFQFGENVGKGTILYVVVFYACFLFHYLCTAFQILSNREARSDPHVRLGGLLSCEPSITLRGYDQEHCESPP